VESAFPGGTIDGHRRRCRAMPPRLRARHSPDRRSWAQRSQPPGL